LKDPVVIKHDNFRVVRDDLLPGGTKVRLAKALFDAYPDKTCFAYGGGVAAGMAQVALAQACKQFNKEFHMWLAKRNELHPYTKRAVELGMHLHELKMGMLSVTRARSREFAAAREDCLDIPMGLDIEPCLAELERVGRNVSKQLGGDPKECWSVAASGTLTRGLQRAWPKTKFFAVQIGHKLNQADVGRAELIVCPLKFQQKPKKEDRPPFPAVPEYDQKAWKYMKEMACRNALFWNVAGDVPA